MPESFDFSDLMVLSGLVELLERAATCSILEGTGVDMTLE
jgi:hypothetical protein